MTQRPIVYECPNCGEAITVPALEGAVARLKEQEEALDKGKRFERAYQESLGATPTPAQWERLESLQSAFLEAYLALSADTEAQDG